MENTSINNTESAGKKLFYGLGATVAVLALVLIISLASNSSKASKINVLEGQVTGLHVTLQQHDSTAAAIELSQAQAIAADSVRIANDRQLAAQVSKSLAGIEEKVNEIGK